jgi:GDP-mannose 6-dehydrogenase
MTVISVFGLGYVGCVSAACFAKEGHRVIGVDVSESKVSLINRGLATIVEESIGELVAEMVGAGHLMATTDVERAVLDSAISLVCVGTPSQTNGALDLSYVTRVCEQIGEVLKGKPSRHVIVIRSTVLPGTIHQVVIPAIERSSGLQAGRDFGVCSNPEFLREGTSIRDFRDPPFTLIGADDPESGRAVQQLYAGIDAPIRLTDVRVAEMVKYACNSFHGLKVAFANEIGNICKGLDVDSHEVMRIFCEDRKLNISSAYLRPGFAFGGSCLPKDLRAITYRARLLDLEAPVLSATLASNQEQIERAFRLIADHGQRRVGLLGLAFKAGTDDLRESPLVTLVERLLGKGYQVSIYDRDVHEARLIGTNREYIEREIPHIWTLMKPQLGDVVDGAETLVIGNGSAEFRAISGRLRPDHKIVDLVRVSGELASHPGYQGICW